jgi:leader peptidase (prepilin peptidase)/N-methyltransferase
MNDTLLALQPLWNAPPAMLPVVLWWALVGLIVGSFLNVVIYRMPILMQRETDNFIALERGEPPPHTTRYNLMLPRSACPSCGHALSARENLPVISFALQGGCCRHCRTPILWRYPLVELLSAALSGLTIWLMGSSFASLAALVLVWALIAMSMIDIEIQMLPDDLNLPLLWLGLLVNMSGTFVPLADAVIGAVAGYLSLWLVYWGFRLATGKEGIGYGDFKLLAALGAWLGWMMLPLIILFASAVGALVGISLILLRLHTREKPMPFGPFLAIAGLLGLWFGPQVVDTWLARGVL